MPSSLQSVGPKETRKEQRKEVFSGHVAGARQQAHSDFPNVAFTVAPAQLGLSRQRREKNSRVKKTSS